MSEVIEDINGFNNLVYMEDRDFAKLRSRMISEVRVPATIKAIGLKHSGMPFVILNVTRQERKSGPKKSEPGQDIPVDPPA
jgi:hypothetical protein